MNANLMFQIIKTIIQRMALCTIVAFVSAMTDSVSAAEWKIPANAPMLTRWAKEVSPTNAWPEYVRAVWKVDPDAIANAIKTANAAKSGQ